MRLVFQQFYSFRFTTISNLNRYTRLIRQYLKLYSVIKCSSVTSYRPHRQLKTLPITESSQSQMFLSQIADGADKHIVLPEQHRFTTAANTSLAEGLVISKFILRYGWSSERLDWINCSRGFTQQTSPKHKQLALLTR